MHCKIYGNTQEEREGTNINGLFFFEPAKTQKWPNKVITQ